MASVKGTVNAVNAMCNADWIQIAISSRRWHRMHAEERGAMAMESESQGVYRHTYARGNRSRQIARHRPPLAQVVWRSIHSKSGQCSPA
jgi:hypothetical protein